MDIIYSLIIVLCLLVAFTHIIYKKHRIHYIKTLPALTWKELGVRAGDIFTMRTDYLQSHNLSSHLMQLISYPFQGIVQTHCGIIVPWNGELVLLTSSTALEYDYPSKTYKRGCVAMNAYDHIMKYDGDIMFHKFKGVWTEEMTSKVAKIISQSTQAEYEKSVIRLLAVLAHFNIEDSGTRLCTHAVAEILNIMGVEIKRPINQIHMADLSDIMYESKKFKRPAIVDKPN